MECLFKNSSPFSYSTLWTSLLLLAIHLPGKRNVLFFNDLRCFSWPQKATTKSTLDHVRRRREKTMEKEVKFSWNWYRYSSCIIEHSHTKMMMHYRLWIIGGNLRKRRKKVVRIRNKVQKRRTFWQFVAGLLHLLQLLWHFSTFPSEGKNSFSSLWRREDS